MKFEWDEAKARSNLAKHDVSFQLATRVWEDALSQVRFDRVVDGEERWQAVGLAGPMVLVVVIHTYPDDETIRIISARQASKRERREYEHEAL